MFYNLSLSRLKLPSSVRDEQAIATTLLLYLVGHSAASVGLADFQDNAELLPLRVLSVGIKVVLLGFWRPRSGLALLCLSN